MPRKPTGTTTVVLHATVEAKDDAAAAAYAEKMSLWKSTVYAQALLWYLDSPEPKLEKERLSEADLRALERGKR